MGAIQMRRCTWGNCGALPDPSEKPENSDRSPTIRSKIGLDGRAFARAEPAPAPRRGAFGAHNRPLSKDLSLGQ